MEVAGKTIILTDGCVGLERLAEVRFELSPATDGVQPDEGRRARDGIGPIENIFVNTAAKTSQRSAAVSFSTEFKARAERKLPVCRSGPRVVVVIGIVLAAVVPTQTDMESSVRSGCPVGDASLVSRLTGLLAGAGGA